MIYKTLHWYILREMLKVFVLTTSTLTTMLAFGGLLKPVTKGGLEIGQLMLVLMNLVPAMLPYSIPISALFAAVLVYWRMSTDNEITACRAGGVSFRAIVVPALALGLLVASFDLVCLNSVVPMFLQRAEVVGQANIGTVAVNAIGRQEPFHMDKMVVYADSAEELAPQPGDTPSDVDSRTVVRLNGMAASIIGKDGRANVVVLARTALAKIDEVRSLGETHILVQLDEGTAFQRGENNNTYQKVSLTVRSLPLDGKPFVIPSLVRNKPKFMDWFQLRELVDDPLRYGPVGEAYRDIERLWRGQKLMERLLAGWRPNVAMPFDHGAGETLSIQSPQAWLGEERQLELGRSAGQPVEVVLAKNGKDEVRYTADAAELTAEPNALDSAGGGSEVLAGLIKLTGNVKRENLRRNTGPIPAERVVEIPGLVIPPEVAAAPGPLPRDSLVATPAAFTPTIRNRSVDLQYRIQKLFDVIGSEKQSRGSFSLSCLTLVVLGAALGIMLRGQNPLAVFVVGFMPAVVLVLLIITGRKMVENTSGHVAPGYVVIWGGNILLVFILAGVYSKLLRQ